MSKVLIVGALALALGACAGGEARELGEEGGAGNGSGLMLLGGARVGATLDVGLSSRVNKSGESFQATVIRDVADSRGNVVIPGGSTVTLAIGKIEPGSDQTRPEGRLELSVISVRVNGTSYPLYATLDPVTHKMVGRGITKDEAARIAAGTAVGAGVGQMIGKNTKSTVIGGAVGAVAGTAVAVHYAYRDVVVEKGTAITFTLTQAMAVAAR